MKVSEDIETFHLQLFISLLSPGKENWGRDYTQPTDWKRTNESETTGGRVRVRKRRGEVGEGKGEGQLSVAL